MGEDVDFCWRLRDRDYLLEFRPVGRIFHKHRNRLTAFCRRRFDYGTSEPLLQGLHRDRVKQFFLPPFEASFWAIFALAVILRSSALLIACGGVLAGGCILKYIKIRNRRIPIGFATLSLAVIRSHLTFIIHCCGFVSRYYLVVAVLLLPFLPPAAVAILVMHLLAGIVEYRIKGAGIHPPAFLFYFSLEQFSYQAGVWWGCLKRLNFKPVFPRIVWTRGAM